MKKHVLAALTAFLLSALTLGAVPAYPGWIRYTQPDGTVIRIRKVGDEFGHFTLNAAGEYLEMDADGFYRPADATEVQTRFNRAAARRRTATQMRRAGNHIALGQKHFLVVLVEFSDCSFTSETAHEDFSNLLNQPGYSENGATGSARDFYYENSHGVFEPIFDVYGPILMSQPSSYYGKNDNQGNDMHPEEAVIEACKAIDDEVDFSQYDLDGDGFVDLVFMYYAGWGEADGGATTTIWPHQWNIYYGAGTEVKLDGVKLDSYACSNEISNWRMCGIGTACHEFGHAMGLPDFYDTNYSDNGFAAGMYEYSTMDTGVYNNDSRTPPFFTVEERILLGWIGEDAFREFTASGPVVLPSVDENIAYRTFTDQEGEYFVYECRGSNGWDAYLPAHGLIVTHVDKSDRSVSVDNFSVPAYYLWTYWDQYNAINANGSHPCCRVVAAADPSNLKFGFTLIQGYYYFDVENKGLAQQIPFPCRANNKEINSYAATSWNGVESDIRLTDISYADNQVTLVADVPRVELDYNVIANPGKGVYAAGSRFSFQLEESTFRVPESVLWYYDDEPVQADSVTLTAGAHTIEAHITLSSGITKIATLEIIVN